MTVLFWRKPGRISEKKGKSEIIPIWVNRRHLPTSHAGNTKHACQPVPSLDTETGQQPGEAHQPCTTVFKKIVTMPFKALFIRRGAEVHDSAGLNEAVAYYVSATLDAEDRFWGGRQGQARHNAMWG